MLSRFDFFIKACIHDFVILSTRGDMSHFKICFSYMLRLKKRLKVLILNLLELHH